MLRITENGSTEETTTLRLEGQMIGQGVAEVQKICEQYLAEGRRLVLDLAEMLFVDRSGVALLRELMRREVRLTRCSPFLTEQLRETNSIER
ncbi:MAG TPA: STAS domain-containing protein [Blastocatellia bacterium]|nr:STAS domain-containing protein [Blastocatellia bacterium]